MKKRTALILLALTLILLTGCAGREEVSPYADIPKPKAVITMESGATMTFTLDPASAPNTVSNFITLANTGFYDGAKIDYVYPTYFMKIGDIAGDGTGEPGYAIAGEFSKNGYTMNNLSHERGVISMCRLENDYNSAGCQFFIMQSTRLEYDGDYAAFGWIEPGDAVSLKTLDDLCFVSLDKNYRPLIKQTIASIRVDTKGYDYTVIKYGEEITPTPPPEPTPDPFTLQEETEPQNTPEPLGGNL
ncbi:MAG: peptidylprolyl isomerase [Clostridia bacterium]|nr:peptidylprolyl isomerase [Clostridia bacterium]